jgi:hypothetical protein
MNRRKWLWLFALVVLWEFGIQPGVLERHLYRGASANAGANGRLLLVVRPSWGTGCGDLCLGEHGCQDACPHTVYTHLTVTEALAGGLPLRQHYPRRGKAGAVFPGLGTHSLPRGGHVRAAALPVTGVAGIARRSGVHVAPKLPVPDGGTVVPALGLQRGVLGLEMAGLLVPQSDS